MFEKIYRLFFRINRILRARFFYYLGQPNFYRCGRGSKIFGWKNISVGKKVVIGDFCWIEAVMTYGVQIFNPKIIIGDNVAISDFTHISSAQKICIDSGCLLGSKIYIGDHSHGSVKSSLQLSLEPGGRPLENIEEIYIGKNTWIGDGVVILAGTKLADSCVVAANSVVKLKVDRPAIIAGNPAIIVRYL